MPSVGPPQALRPRWSGDRVECVAPLLHPAPTLAAGELSELLDRASERPGLRGLSLQGYRLPAGAAEVLASFLRAAPALRWLDVGRCEFTAEAAAELLTACSAARLVWLDLTLTTAGALCESLRTKSLRVLSLRYSPTTCEQLAQLLRRCSGLDTVDARCCALLGLPGGGCAVSAAGGRAAAVGCLAEAVRGARKLRRLLLHGNGFDAAEAEQLRAACPAQTALGLDDAQSDAALRGAASLCATLLHRRGCGPTPSDPAAALRELARLEGPEPAAQLPPAPRETLQAPCAAESATPRWARRGSSRPGRYDPALARRRKSQHQPALDRSQMGSSGRLSHSRSSRSGGLRRDGTQPIMRRGSKSAPSRAGSLRSLEPATPQQRTARPTDSNGLPLWLGMLDGCEDEIPALMLTPQSGASSLSPRSLPEHPPATAEVYSDGSGSEDGDPPRPPDSPRRRGPWVKSAEPQQLTLEPAAPAARQCPAPPREPPLSAARSPPAARDSPPQLVVPAERRGCCRSATWQRLREDIAVAEYQASLAAWSCRTAGPSGGTQPKGPIATPSRCSATSRDGSYLRSTASARARRSSKRPTTQGPPTRDTLLSAQNILLGSRGPPGPADTFVPPHLIYV